MTPLQTQLLKLVGVGAHRASLEEIQAKLVQTVGSTFISVVLCAQPKMRKFHRTEKDISGKKLPNPYYGDLLKVNKHTGIVNFQYEEGVRRRLIKEGKDPDDFVRGESWHKPLIIEGKLTPFCIHKQTGVPHLRFMLRDSGKAEFFTIENHRPVIKDDVVEYLVDNDDAYANQELDDPLRIITPAMHSIQSVAFGGETLTIGV